MNILTQEAKKKQAIVEYGSFFIPVKSYAKRGEQSRESLPCVVNGQKYYQYTAVVCVKMI